MKLTLRKDLDINSITVQHNILIRATMLLEGREGVLETEKVLRLMLAMIDMLVEEDVIDECNKDDRDLMTIMMTDIEPFFNSLLKEEKYEIVWNNMKRILLERCDRIWKSQHSAMGVMDAILTTIVTMSDEDKKEALIATGEMAEKAFDRRTAKMEAAAEKVDSKLEQFVKAYQEKQEQEIKNTNDTE